MTVTSSRMTMSLSNLNKSKGLMSMNDVIMCNAFTLTRSQRNLAIMGDF